MLILFKFISCTLELNPEICSFKVINFHASESLYKLKQRNDAKHQFPTNDFGEVVVIFKLSRLNVVQYLSQIEHNPAGRVLNSNQPTSVTSKFL